MSKTETKLKEAEKPTPEPAKGPETPAPRRRGVKAEVVPMRWKVVGISEGLVLTLLKSIDKAAAESEYARLEGDSRYDQLGVYPIDARIEAPKSAGKRAPRKDIFEVKPPKAASRSKKAEPKKDAKKETKSAPAKTAAGKPESARKTRAPAPKSAKAKPAKAAKPKPRKKPAKPSAKKTKKAPARKKKR